MALPQWTPPAARIRFSSSVQLKITCIRPPCGTESPISDVSGLSVYHVAPLLGGDTIVRNGLSNHLSVEKAWYVPLNTVSTDCKLWPGPPSTNQLGEPLLTCSQRQPRLPAQATVSEGATTLEIDGKPTQSDALPTEGRTRLLLASVPPWAIAGFISRFIPVLIVASPLPWKLPTGANFLIHVFGLPEQLAIRIGFAAAMLPLTSVFAATLGAAQCLILRAVRPWAGRWVLAAAAGGALAWATGLMLSLYPDLSPASITSPWLLVLHSSLRGALLGGFVSIVQRWSMRGRVFVPGWFVLASVIASGAGALAVVIWALSALGSLR
jgi:hypothetical protein